MKSFLFYLICLISIHFCFCNIEKCNYTLVESIPEGLNYTNENVFRVSDTYEEWIKLIESAKHSISIAQFYFTLRCKDVIDKKLKTCLSGEKVLKAFINAASNGIKVKIVLNFSKEPFNKDLELLKEAGAEIKYLNFQKLVGAGILHTKFIIVDDTKFYLGSSNMDWRSLTQVKEIGFITKSPCKTLSGDLVKIFSIYWYLSDQSKIPENLPSEFETNINMKNPLKINLNNVVTDVYLTSSPLKMNSKNRTNDIDAILNIINSAKKYIYFSVMDYSPTFLFQRPKYWPIIDNALRDAAITRGVQVKIIVGWWKNSRIDMLDYLKSLNSLQHLKNKGSIKVSLFKVPFTKEEQKLIPYVRVDHAKFLLSENQGFIGTSNWSADYFVNTGGVSLVTTKDNNESESIRSQLKSIFERDFNSDYCTPLQFS